MQSPLPHVSPPGHLPFQDHLLSITLMTQRAPSKEDIHSNCTVSLHNVTTVWSAISRLSPKYNSTDLNRSVPGDLNREHAASFPHCNCIAAFYFKTITRVYLYRLEHLFPET